MTSLCCGCFSRKQNKKSKSNDLYEPLLLDKERDAVNDLLKFLQNDEVSTEITSDRLSALRTLAYSDNVDLQRSAALCFSEISERMTHPVTDGILEPLITLLRSPDVEVQTASSLALSNFALFGPAENKDVIVRGGALQALAELLLSDNVDVQCNACGCMTTLATSERNKHEIANQGTIPSLLKLSRSSDPRVQRNATGALLNLTHLERNRYELARCGAIPVFVSLVQSRDPDVQFYCAAALSNMAVQVEHRVLMIQIGGGEILRHLILLLSSTVEKVKCQSCLALRNLASDAHNQLRIVDLGGLRSLHPLLSSQDIECCTAAVAALRNLSIYKGNEASKQNKKQTQCHNKQTNYSVDCHVTNLPLSQIAIIRERLLPDLCRLLKSSPHPDIQCHAAGTIRNIATEDQKDEILKEGCVEALVDILLEPNTKDTVSAEVSAALAVLASSEKCQERMASLRDGQFIQCVLEMCVSAQNAELRYNCVGIVGHLALDVGLHGSLLECKPSLLDIIRKCIETGNVSHIHIGIWSLSHLSEGDDKTRQRVSESGIMKLLDRIKKDEMSSEIQQLIETIVNNLHSKPEGGSSS